MQAGALPQSLQSLDGIPNAFRYGLTALASERIPNRMSTSRCVMTTLHLGRDDWGEGECGLPSLPYGVSIRTRDWHFAMFGLRNKDTMSLGCVALVHPTLLMFIKYCPNTYKDIQVLHTGYTHG